MDNKFSISYSNIHFNGELIGTYRTLLFLIDILTHLITLSLSQHYGNFQFHIYLLLYDDRRTDIEDARNRNEWDEKEYFN